MEQVSHNTPVVYLGQLSAHVHARELERFLLTANKSSVKVATRPACLLQVRVGCCGRVSRVAAAAAGGAASRQRGQGATQHDDDATRLVLLQY